MPNGKYDSRMLCEQQPVKLTAHKNESVSIYLHLLLLLKTVIKHYYIAK